MSVQHRLTQHLTARLLSFSVDRVEDRLALNPARFGPGSPLTDLLIGVDQDQDFIVGCFEVFLGRRPGVQELTNHIAVITGDGGTDEARRGFIASILASPEFLVRVPEGASHG